MTKMRVNAIVPDGLELRWRGGHPWPAADTIVEVSDYDPDDKDQEGPDPEKDLTTGQTPSVINQRTLRLLEADDHIVLNTGESAAEIKDNQMLVKRLTAENGELRAKLAAGTDDELLAKLIAVEAERDECAAMVRSYNKELGEVKTAALAELEATKGKADETIKMLEAEVKKLDNEVTELQPLDETPEPDASSDKDKAPPANAGEKA